MSIIDFKELCGWVNDRPLIEEGFASLPDHCKETFKIVGAPNNGVDPRFGVRRMMLFEVAKKLLGYFPKNYPQQIGDCTSFGAKNAVEYLTPFEILNGAPFQWKYVYPPYFYGASRVLVGGGRMWGDGSTGSWTAAAANKYGVLFADTEGLDTYSGGIARAWGRNGPPKQFIPIAQKYPVKTVNKLSTTDQLLDTLCNGYSATIASDVGFDMKQRNDGFMHYSTHWGHQMSVIGADEGDSKVKPHFCILNSWGDVFGQIVDWRTNEPWPPGTLRVTFDDMQRILDADDSYAYSNFDGFPAQFLPEEFFSTV